MRRKLYKQDWIELVTGGNFRSDGGDVTLEQSLAIIEKIDKIKPIEVELLTIDEMDDSFYALTAATLGSPLCGEALAMDLDEINVYYAFKGLEAHLAKEGKKVGYLYTWEYGGWCMAATLSLAMRTGLPLLDIDGCGRSTPAMYNFLPALYDLPTSPATYANTKGDVVLIQTADPQDTETFELMGRHLSVPYDMNLGFSMSPVTKTFAQECLLPGALTRLQNTGKAILEAKATGADPVEKIKNVINAKEICRGIVEYTELKADIGFDYGKTTIKADNGRFNLHIQNENVIITDESGKIIGTAPDSICLIDLKTYRGLTNPELKHGMFVSVIAIRAEESWRTAPRGLSCWKPIFKNIGFDIEPISFF